MDITSMLPAGLGLGGEFNSPVGQAVERATSERLAGPDWSANMQICDEINSRVDGPSTATKALKRRLKSENSRVLQLTLTLCEATVKNCGRPLHQAVGTRDFLTEVVNIAKSGQPNKDVQSQALGLIQDWGIAFEHDRSLAFGEAYGRLRTLGARFPATDSTPPVFTPPPSSTSTYRGSVEPVQEASSQTLDKLQKDLQVVMDKVTLCRQMMSESRDVEKDEALYEVVGFLEACRPRMVDLVEAGVTGALGEGVFGKCLKINDSLLRTLQALNDGSSVPVEDGEENAADAPLLDLEGGRDDGITGKMSSFSIDGADDEDADQLSGVTPGLSSSTGGKISKLGAVPLKSSTAAQAQSSKPSADGSGVKAANTEEEDLDDFLASLGEGPSTGATGGTISSTAKAGNDDEDIESFLA